MPAPRGTYVTDCLAEGLVEQLPWHLPARAQRQGGESLFNIAVELGMSYAAVHAFFNPEYYRRKLALKNDWAREKRATDPDWADRDRARCTDRRRLLRQRRQSTGAQPMGA